MNEMLRKVTVFIGLALLIISIYWSVIGFDFQVAGDAATNYKNISLAIAITLAISVTVLQFVFSTNLKELNATLILLAVIAYGYSIYTNYIGILVFQGSAPNKVFAFFLAVGMDVAPEHLIAWGLGESRDGDFIGNLWSALFGGVGKKPRRRPSGGGGGSRPKSKSNW